MKLKLLIILTIIFFFTFISYVILEPYSFIYKKNGEIKINGEVIPNVDIYRKGSRWICCFKHKNNLLLTFHSHSKNKVLRLYIDPSAKKIIDFPFISIVKTNQIGSYIFGCLESFSVKSKDNKSISFKTGNHPIKNSKYLVRQTFKYPQTRLRKGQSNLLTFFYFLSRLFYSFF